MNRRHKRVLCGMLALFVAVLIVASVSEAAYGQKKILVDLTHAERISMDSMTSPNLDISSNNRIFNWTDWADYMRGEGYAVDVLTEGPITVEKLGDYCVLIIAEPDVTVSGPAYFTTDECTVIKEFVEDGGGLLLMGTQLVGGSSMDEFIADYYTVYHYPEIHNALLENLSVGMRFAEGMMGPDPYDVMADDGIVDHAGGPKGNIWIHEGDKSHPIWDNVTDGKFAYWHGCSINVTDESIVKVATGDDDTYTSVKNMDYSPIVKPSGSYPVAIAATDYGNGWIVAYGDAGCWQGKVECMGGAVFTDPKYHEQELAQNIIEYLAGPIPTGNITVLARISADSNGNFTFSNLTAGSYTVTSVLFSPMGWWTMGSVNTTIVKGELLTDADTWLTTAEEEAVNEILNATVDPSGLVGTSSISGRVLAQTPFGTVPGANATVVIAQTGFFFDTGTPVNPYPCIFGVHNGTFVVTHPVAVERMYTYACTGTGGHSEFVKIWNTTGWDVSATWNGYTGDWHTIVFSEPFTLKAGETYNYTIRTGSYPQIHHIDELDADGGTIRCTKFVDANGKVYNNWIPAIRLEGS
ncbi:MAG: hypothetical protein J7K81_02530 [Methanophagales archaeon]|nr:hypothetical protein [Methanophagales archaeon]